MFLCSRCRRKIVAWKQKKLDRPHTVHTRHGQCNTSPLLVVANILKRTGFVSTKGREILENKKLSF